MTSPASPSLASRTVQAARVFRFMLEGDWSLRFCVDMAVAAFKDPVAVTASRPDA